MSKAAGGLRDRRRRDVLELLARARPASLDQGQSGPPADQAARIKAAREDLRTLYVACTRAEDYLILSAALKSDFSPQSPWMLTLAERFDLKTGKCLGSDLPPETVPKVAIAGPEAPAPSPAGRPAAQRTTRKASPPAVAVEPTSPLPRIWTVGEVEALLASGPRP